MKKNLWMLMVALALTGSAGAETPEERVRAFYDWYLKNPMTARDRFAEAEKHFEKELFSLLTQGFGRGPSDGFWIDFDPFVNAQMEASKVDIAKAQKDVNIAQVKVTPTFSRGGQGQVFKVYLLLEGKQWKIQNFVYPEFNLRDFLKRGLAE